MIYRACIFSRSVASLYECVLISFDHIYCILHFAMVRFDTGLYYSTRCRRLAPVAPDACCLIGEGKRIFWLPCDLWSDIYFLLFFFDAWMFPSLDYLGGFFLWGYSFCIQYCSRVKAFASLLCRVNLLVGARYLVGMFLLLYIRTYHLCLRVAFLALGLLCSAGKLCCFHFILNKVYLWDRIYEVGLIKGFC